VVEDAEFVWHCRNERSAREQSRRVTPIPLEAHLTWFCERLESTETRFLIVEIDSTPTGYIRLNRSEHETEMSIALEPSVRGKGVGTRAIREAAETESRENSKPIAAYVKNGNTASLTAFRRAGFDDDSVSNGLHRLIFYLGS
jgi:L-amino acid N-acyltransferase YncA